MEEMEQYRAIIEKLVLFEYTGLISPDDLLLLNGLRKEPGFQEMIDHFRNFILSQETQAALERFEESRGEYFAELFAKPLHRKIKQKRVDIAEQLRGLPVYPN